MADTPTGPEDTNNLPGSAGAVPDDVQAFAAKLFDLARNGDASLLDYIDAGVDVDMTNQDGNSFLMLAAYSGHADLVAALAARGANPDKTNERGQTPIAGAVFKKEDAVIDALLTAGADPTLGTPDAIATAQMFGRDDLVQRFTGA
ncbi:ankyrin repeat domain-containing protein [Corynebacterium aquatimens]|uniref:Ankyrin repeat protein n=1 Tax=Corynebacterium aquatimens TaxID=1190508 RepID=A0A931E2N3_9CORY|nr:ankyrin repeat domain-containing protein [Corynebacterium aquatimens]MBG6122111.1 ankyrin repeat protein [Corynebacterium aquatimens]WJY65348.1 Ankyrin repeats (3 copies) [Corynebacterium aquatimens]